MSVESWWSARKIKLNDWSSCQKVASLQKSGPTTVSTLTTTNGLQFSAGVFIDASYEGDLLPLAGISYTVGRVSVLVLMSFALNPFLP